jgi:hypothetical protein
MNWRELDQHGIALLAAVYDTSAVGAIGTALEMAFAADRSEAVRRSESGCVFAARNILSLWPAAAVVWRQPSLFGAIRMALGPSFGLVRGLFFDKPPEHTWSLPWHKDLTIAVREHRPPNEQFSKPTTKVGVPHVEAPVEVLEHMLTARIHLDQATEENGVLYVVPGSHRLGKAMPADDHGAVPVIAAAGDVLLMRPLVAHCSGSSAEGTALHRRVLHLEFAASQELPGGYHWQEFIPGGGSLARGGV